MEARGESTWSDQWDNNNSAPNPGYVTPDEQKKSKSANYKQKVGQGLGKTKTVASHSFKKAKEGSAVGFFKVKETTVLSFRWIKTKYQKVTQKKN